jgi:thioredoxin reductase
LLRTVGAMDDYDVIVIGGGAAGLSGALTLARARRSVLLLDAGQQRNLPAAGVHGYLTRDGISPSELVELGAAEVIRYGGEIRRVAATGARRSGSGFLVVTADGAQLRARRLLLGTGLVDELPDIPGLAQRWGRDVLHCPYCHGWEFRDQAIGVLGTGPHATQKALLFRQWSPRVTLFLHTAPDPTDEQWEQLAARGIQVVDGEVARLEVVDDRLAGVRLASGRVVGCAALALSPRMVARGTVAAGLGLEPVEHPLGVGQQLPADPSGQTPVPGVWVAGNLDNLLAGVVQAAAEGVTAAAAINADLVAEDTGLAVERRAGPFSAASEAANCERVLGDRRHGLTTARS